jgi:hypothetical protein
VLEHAVLEIIFGDTMADVLATHARYLERMSDRFGMTPESGASADE